MFAQVNFYRNCQAVMNKNNLKHMLIKIQDEITTRTQIKENNYLMAINVQYNIKKINAKKGTIIEK